MLAKILLAYSGQSALPRPQNDSEQEDVLPPRIEVISVYPTEITTTGTHWIEWELRIVDEG